MGVCLGQEILELAKRVQIPGYELARICRRI
jgi:hypothetical protein